MLVAQYLQLEQTLGGRRVSHPKKMGGWVGPVRVVRIEFDVLHKSIYRITIITLVLIYYGYILRLEPRFDKFVEYCGKCTVCKTMGDYFWGF